MMIKNIILLIVFMTLVGMIKDSNKICEKDISINCEVKQ